MDAPSDPPAPTRWELIRDVLVFQLKLVLDATRDAVLVPISLVAAAFDLLTGGERPGRTFYQVLRTGRRAEDWINLFGELDRVEPGASETPREGGTVDGLVGQVEGLVRDHYERGGVTASAKEGVDRSLDAVERARSGLLPRRRSGDAKGASDDRR